RLPEILFLTHRVPYPPDRGDRIRSWNILRYIARRARVSLACVTDEPVSWKASQTLAASCQRVAMAPVGRRRRWVNAGSHWLAGKSLTEGLFWSKSLASTLDYWADVISFDYVFVYCSSMLPYAEREALRDIPRVVDLVDVDSQKWRDYAAKSRFVRRLVYRAEAKRLSRLEKICVARSKAVLLASEAEADLLRIQHGTRNPSILGVSNGVDFSYFQNRGSAVEAPSPASPSGPGSAGLRLVFVGVLDYLPNVDGLGWFLNQVWPGLRQQLPAATLE
ncbi:MAG: sugar transferase, partial [bacterium]